MEITSDSYEEVKDLIVIITHMLKLSLKDKFRSEKKVLSFLLSAVSYPFSLLTLVFPYLTLCFP